MALYAWRFQAEVAKGEVDPMVTVFVGPERYIMDEMGVPTQETFVDKDVTNPVLCKLSELPDVIANPTLLTQMRKEALDAIKEAEQARLDANKKVQEDAIKMAEAQLAAMRKAQEAQSNGAGTGV